MSSHQTRTRRSPEIPSQNRLLTARYALTGHLYDILDYPWERQYRHWRPKLVGDLSGDVLEAGVGTGRNLPYYSHDAVVTGVDLSTTMLRYAARRSRHAACCVELRYDDATQFTTIDSASFDVYISTFMCCVMPDELQPAAIAEMVRVLRPGGRFRLLEMVYSQSAYERRKQRIVAPVVEFVYGARFDRNTLQYLHAHPELIVTATRYLKRDTYLLIEGTRKPATQHAS